MSSILPPLTHAAAKPAQPYAALAHALALTAMLNGSTAAELLVPAKYATIQGAVDAAASGDVVRIAPGVYTNQVRIDGKKLSLIGEPGTILRATANLPLIPRPGENHFNLLYGRESEITLRGLTFEGERLGDSYAGPGELRGVLLRACTATIDHCAFYGFRERIPGDRFAVALVATATSTLLPLRVTHCTFADNYGAIKATGSAVRHTMNVVLENNTIIGPGPLERGWPAAGVIIREGVGGRIAFNTIRGFSYTGTLADVDIAFGIEASNQGSDEGVLGILEPLEIEGNILQDNQVHMSLSKANGSIVKGNLFRGSAPGILPIGLALSGTNVVATGNQFENMPEGIRLFGDDPMFGDFVGVAVNAIVTGSRFCNVTEPINKQPLASFTETGTQLCPLPGPILGVAPSVLLTWSQMDDGFLVESAPTSSGPWSLLASTPAPEDGLHTLAVPAGTEHRFFRLRKATPP